MTSASTLKHLQGGLIASCQPVRGGPLDRPPIVTALALATLAGGAVALRLEGLADLRAVRPQTHRPIIGLVKRNSPETQVYITPDPQDVQDLSAAGADIIAFDATQCLRSTAVPQMIECIHAEGRLAMADVATVAEGTAAWLAGADLIGTTLSGYTPASPALDGPDVGLVQALAGRGVRVIAEGRVQTPEQARTLLLAGAYAVAVGSALTRLELLTRRFADALNMGETCAR